MMAGIVVSQEAMDYISEKKMKRPNLVLYRDVSGIVMSYTRGGLNSSRR